VALNLINGLPESDMGKLNLLAEAAAEYYDAPLQQLKSPNQLATYTRPRHICQWVAADAGYKNAAIAKFWNLDRSAVYYGRKVVGARIARSKSEAAEVRRFMEFVGKYIAGKKK